MDRLSTKKEMLLTNLKYKKIQYCRVVKEYNNAKKTASQKELDYLLAEDRSTFMSALFTASVVVPCFLVGTLSGISLFCTANNQSLLGGIVIASVGIGLTASIVIPKFVDWSYSYTINQVKTEYKQHKATEVELGLRSYIISKEIEKLEECIYHCEQKQIDECSKKFIEKDFGAEK